MRYTRLVIIALVGAVLTFRALAAGVEASVTAPPSPGGNADGRFPYMGFVPGTFTVQGAQYSVLDCTYDPVRGATATIAIDWLAAYGPSSFPMAQGGLGVDGTDKAP